MKKLLNLSANLRVFFGVAQLLTAVAGVVILALWLWAPLAIARPRNVNDHYVVPVPFLNAPLKLPVGSLSIKSETSNARDIEITHLAGEFSLNLVSSDPKLVAAIRWTLLPRYTCAVIFSLVLFGLLRGICTRIERGDVFNAANLRAVRNVGLVVAISALIDGALTVWSQIRLGGYLATQTTITGINASFDAGPRVIPNFPFSDLITGLLILLLAEAFRQGLALKKENDLTV